MVKDLEDDIASGAFTKTSYTHTDPTMMPALVKKANDRDAAMKIKKYV
ncbi:YopJ family acetyltransferase [Bartonella doshiae]